MAFAFDGYKFGQVLEDAKQVVDRARDLEHRLTTLVNTLEANMRATPTEPPGLSSLVETIRSLCIESRTNRQLAEAVLMRLIGDRVRTEQSSDRQRVLVVDDDPGNLEIVSMVLEDAGLDVVTARNGLDAVIAAHAVRPSVIVMDLTMPVMNGVDAARFLKMSPATRHINVIAHTAERAMHRPETTGLFADILIKPASPAVVLTLMKRLIPAVSSRESEEGRFAES